RHNGLSNARVTEVSPSEKTYQRARLRRRTAPKSGPLLTQSGHRRLSNALFVPRMVRIIRTTKYITALAHPALVAELLGAGLLIVMRCAQAGESVERREGLRHQALLAAAF